MIYLKGHACLGWSLSGQTILCILSPMAFVWRRLLGFEKNANSHRVGVCESVVCMREWMCELEKEVEKTIKIGKDIRDGMTIYAVEKTIQSSKTINRTQWAK